MAEVNISQHYSDTSGYISSLKSELDDKIDDLKSSLSSISLSHPWRSLIEDAIEVDLPGDWVKATTVAQNALQYTPVASRDLLGAQSGADNTHVWEGEELNVLEDKLIEITQAYSYSEIKNIDGLLIGQALLDSLVEKEQGARSRTMNDAYALLNRYPTANTLGNTEWLETRFGYAVEDGLRELYIGLFDLAQASAKWSMAKQVEIEEIHSSFTASYNKLLDGLVRANIAAYHGEVDANIAKLNANIKKLEAEIQVNDMKSEEMLTEKNLLVEQKNKRLLEYVSSHKNAMSSALSTFYANVDGSKALGDAYRSIAAAYSQRYTSVVLGKQTTG